MDKQEYQLINDAFFWVAVMIVFVLAVMATACAPPKVSELLGGDGINCKAAITMPDERPREGETVNVAVRIYDCTETEVR